MLLRNFHFYNLKSIFLADFPYQSFRSFLYAFLREYLLPIFGAPNQMVARFIYRMTRSLHCHALAIPCHTARAYMDKGDVPLPLMNPLGKACIHPRGKPRGILQRPSIKLEGLLNSGNLALLWR